MHERISALLDGELDQSETEEILTLVARDSDLSAKWQRYHLIRAVVRQESLTHISGIAERMQPMLAGEDAEPPRVNTTAFGQTNWTPRFAIAACLIGLLGVGVFSILPDQNGNKPLQQVARTAQATKWESATPGVEHTLNAFLVEHGEFTPMSSMNGLMAYAKFVSYDSE